QDQIGLRAQGGLMSFARAVLFTDEVAARLFKGVFREPGEIAVVIDYQNARPRIHRFRD
ncbi:MAG: hypothetical protein QOI34_454, partial [Verrucomicrobiota bacterium]